MLEKYEKELEKISKDSDDDNDEDDDLNSGRKKVKRVSIATNFWLS